MELRVSSCQLGKLDSISRLSIFGTAAAGNVAPLAETPLPANAWDLEYDAENDRMYVALVNGTIAVFDDYVANDFVGTPDRTITPSDASGTKISVNCHGIVYDAIGDRLVVSDVGDPMSATDGQIFVIDSGSTSDGNVSVSRQLGGASTNLGNPVDLVLSGTELRVAEKSNGVILVYSDIYTGDSGDVAPDLQTASPSVESLVELVASADRADISDSESTSTTVLAVAVSSNPAQAGATSGEISRFNAALESQLTTFDTALGLESVTFDLTGDAYGTFDDGTSGGIVIANRVARSRVGGAFSASRDRTISGTNTGLIAPKGLDVSTENGLIFVAENSEANASVLVFSSCASGNVNPLITLTATGAVRPWDVDYDPAEDRAYVALTNGTVAVFDQVVATLDSGTATITGESRLITPGDGGTAFAAPTNIHGIDYDSASDSLIISDVADPASADDGKIYVVPGAATASDITDVTVNIAGASTNLGNPVDLMFDGVNIYVAEKSNGAVLRFDDILNSSGGDVAPDSSVAYTAPESVAIIPNHLSLAPGQ